MSQIGRHIFQFVTTVVLARLLVPEDFGLIAMISVFTGFAGTFTQIGLGAALVQNQNVEERHYSSVFWLNVATGFFLMICVAASGPLIAAFYSEPRLSNLTIVVALCFFVGSFNIVQLAILRRKLNFRLLAGIEIVSALVGDVGAIALALSGYGVWSLACKPLLATVITAISAWKLTGWRPQFQLDRSAVRDLLNFSSNALGFSASTYWISNADNLLIGKFIGPVGLGLYARAYNLMLLPVLELFNVVSRVMFPAFSRIQEDKTRIKRIYLKAVGATSLFIFPMMWGLFVVSNDFVQALYGPKWHAVVPILEILCLVGLAEYMSATTGWLFLSLGRSDWMFRWSIVRGAVTLFAFAVSIRWGVTGVASAYAVTRIPLTYVEFYLAGKLINLPFREVLRNVSGILACSVVMAAFTWVVGVILPHHWSAWARLLVLVTCAVLFYFGLVSSFNLTAFQIVRQLAVERWQLRHSGQLRQQTAISESGAD